MLDPGRGVRNGPRGRRSAPREAVLLASYVGNLYFALTVALWLGVLKAHPAFLVLPPLVYGILRVAVEGLPLRNPYDLRSLLRAARAARVLRLLRLYLAALGTIVLGLYALAYFAAAGGTVRIVAALAPAGVAGLHAAVLLIVGRLAARIDTMERAAGDKPLSYGPRVMADGRPVNIVHNPSETLH